MQKHLAGTAGDARAAAANLAADVAVAAEDAAASDNRSNATAKRAEQTTPFRALHLHGII